MKFVAGFVFSVLSLLLPFGGFAKKVVDKKKRPPGPSGLPIIGNLHQIGSMPHRFLAKLAKTYGPLLLLNLAQLPTLVVSSANMAEPVLKVNDLAFSSRPLSLRSSVCRMATQTFHFRPMGHTGGKFARFVSLNCSTQRGCSRFSR
ncbi:hypothetical protein AMTRI_Chr06g198550 [Amborella trichopoda]|uniref:Cytochrome P450 n=1 Tax=Amborella trichopoda TaxID=13333 RepID=W1NZM7_AMBTC|nr:hypothetical protein AMTR_s00181p00060490 [Amborella trichopoda]